MTHQRALSPLAPLLASFLCYGFVLVWTQNVAIESTTAFEELSTPFSSAGLKILTGGNFSVSVAPWESTTEPPISTQSGLSLNKSVTFPMTTTTEGQPTMVSMGGAQVTPEDDLMSTIESNRAPLNTTTNNGGNALTTTLGSESGPHMVHDEDGISASTSVSENSKKASSGTTLAAGTMDTTATSTGASSDPDALPRALRKTSSTGGALSWRVTLRSALSRQDAITAFFEKSCDVILKKLGVKDVSIAVGRDRAPMKCF